jgi:hypothetical protein
VPLEQHLVFYGVLGIKDPLRPDVKQAVADCHRAGINVRMVTGDNVITARAIAIECGIITSDKDLVIEGPVFRRMTPKEVDAILPRLKVMARSSPRDKNILVRRLNGNLPKTPQEWEKVRRALQFGVLRMQLRAHVEVIHAHLSAVHLCNVIGRITSTKSACGTRTARCMPRIRWSSKMWALRRLRFVVLTWPAWCAPMLRLT